MSQLKLTKQEITFQIQLLNQQYHETILALRTMLDNAKESPLNPKFLETAERLKIINGDLEKGQKMLMQVD